MIHIPSSLVGIVLKLALDALVFYAARTLRQPDLGPVLLPVAAAIGAYVAARWATGALRIPGLSVGVLSLAARMGLGLGLGAGLLAFAAPLTAMLEITAALAGGLTGYVARRTTAPQPEYTPLS